ncbi:MAG: GNAT family N-acetyltransferase [Paludibacteraceae bacterium]|nr:GNAT family N-acetyltransferase [Paludibacteraceae bacterium]
MKPIIPPVETSILLSELEGHLLRPSNKAGNLIFDITAHECPNVMREIGRLREISYRDGGGGTGKEIDIDDLDIMEKPYHQLIVWDPDNQQIIGGYRYLLGHEIAIDESGQPRIASAHLFQFSPRFVSDFLPYTIEFGRAFVQPAYQAREMGVKALFALDNIWDGIGALVYKYPQLQWMIGKVTLYPSFDPMVRDLLYSFLYRYHPDTEGLLIPYHPLAISEEAQKWANEVFEGDDPTANLHALQLAARQRGLVVPAMFAAYLNLTKHMRTFGTSINDEFGDVLETGIMVAIKDILPEKKERYMQPYIEWLNNK